MLHSYLTCFMDVHTRLAFASASASALGSGLGLREVASTKKSEFEPHVSVGDVILLVKMMWYHFAVYLTF